MIHRNGLALGALDERARRRAAALAAVTVAFAVLLTLLGLGIVVLVLLTLAACAAAGALVVRALGGRAAVTEWVAGLRRAPRRMRPAGGGWQPSADDATVEMALVGPPTQGRHDYGRAPLPTRTQVSERLQRLSSTIQQRIGATLAPRPTHLDVSPGVLGSEAAHCNALGIALRRAGHAKQAATLHEAARVIYAGTGDSRSEALTANVLGVALAEDGRQDAALEQFTHAQTVLRALGDRQWEGKVLANIGLSKQRVGQDDQAFQFLQNALEVLPPDTDAYERVQRRLERAS